MTGMHSYPELIWTHDTNVQEVEESAYQKLQLATHRTDCSYTGIVMLLWKLCTEVKLLLISGKKKK
jgi:hypothetical protein